MAAGIFAPSFSGTFWAPHFARPRPRLFGWPRLGPEPGPGLLLGHVLGFLLTLALRAPAPIASWTSLAGVSVGLVVCRVLLMLTFLVAALGRLSALPEKVPGGDGVLHVPVLRRLMKEEWLHVGAGRNKCPRKRKMGTCAVTQETSGGGSSPC